MSSIVERLIALSLGLTLLASSASATDHADEIRFDRDVQPILSDKCVFCHGPDEVNRQAGLRLDIESEAKADSIVPGDPQASELIARIVATDADELMPPPGSHKELSAAEIDTLTRWVQQGAPWTGHWSFLPPKRTVLSPTTFGEHADWSRGKIDEWVLTQMLEQGQAPSSPASREKMLRRLSFDLTGLPPTLKEIDAFVADSTPNAYETVVDRLLQSNHFGERMAMMWMDAARYGDTSVYHADGPRDMWAWRDAVVNAYNDNMPFDQFSILQLAGDLIDGIPPEQTILAGFNRNNGTTDEGGAIAEEYRVEYVVDRVKTTATVWMGLTMECAQCHDHKYDPISHEEYFQFYAFFNASSDGGMQTRKGNAEPKIDLPDPTKLAKLPAVEEQLTKLQQKIAQHKSDHEPEFQAWLHKAGQNTENSVPAPSGLIAKFLLDEGKGRQVSCAANVDHKGSINGKPIWVDARDDKGLQFNGKNFVDLGDLANFDRTDAFSYGGWVNPDKNGHGALLAKMDDGNGFRGFDLLCGTDRIEVHLINTWPSNALKVTVKPGLTAGEWQHVFATYDGSAKPDGIKIYVDGKEREWTIEQNSLTKTTKTEKTLLIGSRHPGSRLKGKVDEVSVYDRRLEQTEVQQIAGDSHYRSLLAITPEQRTSEQTNVLRQHYFTSEDPAFSELNSKAASLATKIDDLQKPLTSVMVMSDMAKPRETFVLSRGAYDSPTDKMVTPGTLRVLPPMPDDLPRNRLGLAKWLFQDDHPLTSRVAVNRYWQMLFGRGLVSTPEDFGAQGDFPSHPELLDELAVDFRESGWNIKRLIKQIVMSATYRQTSQADPLQYRADPNNVLLARGPRFRLVGEMIRDNALSVSGLLVDQSGGPGVKPYQPAGLWAEVALGGNPKFVQDHGDRLFRRSLYTYWKRSAPPPSMQIFDAPTREKCTLQRARTNTPLQALVTLNDVQFVEAARCFAERILKTEHSSPDDRIAIAFRIATARYPSSDEINVLRDILDSSAKRYVQDVDAAKQLVGLGESPTDETILPQQLAAWTVVASVLLNLDETLTRE